METFFSICIPNYNNERFIGKTIESVLNQTYKNFEIIIADNASTDKSLEIIQSYVKKDRRVKLLQNPKNLGYPATCNIAVKNSSGTHFLLFGGDDLMYEKLLEIYASIIKSNKESTQIFISSACHYIDENDRQTDFKTIDQFVKSEPTGIMPQESELIVNSISNNPSGVYWGSYQSQCYSKKLYDDVTGYDPSFRFNPDLDFTMRILALKPKIFYVKEPLFAYRWHSGSERGRLERSDLSYLMDHYRIYLNSNLIQKYNLNKQKLENNFVNLSCLGPGLYLLMNHKYFTSLSYLAAAFYYLPKTALFRPKTYLLLFALLLWPLSPFVLRLMSKIKKGN